ncbi:hypothetical protein C6496_07260 [Candidatus Poribacteria bacterium]|nr:MAG: hypothetical protein C6496_07260 [Candidatus Poribacteria bacterium]
MLVYKVDQNAGGLDSPVDCCLPVWTFADSSALAEIHGNPLLVRWRNKALKPSETTDVLDITKASQTQIRFKVYVGVDDDDAHINKVLENHLKREFRLLGMFS